jgi:D-alanine--poly(phosphoribitol) ligase subunit 1
MSWVRPPYVPLRTSWPDARTQEIRDLVGIDIVIDSDLHARIVDDEIWVGPAPPPCEAAASPTSPAYIITTSGTTGRPKAVVISREAIENFYAWLATYVTDIDSGDRMLMITDFTFDISHIDVCLLLHKRLSMYFSKFNKNLNIFSLAAEIGNDKITVLNTVPNNCTLLLQDAIVKRAEFSSLTHLILGGARFSSGTYSAVFGHLSNVHVYNMYGPTEATVYSHVAKLTGNVDVDMIDNNVTTGLPILNMHACLVDPDDRVIEPAAVNGHLLLSGVQLINCYFQDEERTNDAIVEIEGTRFYRTGDLAYRVINGRFFVVGRMDDTIKRRGFRVNLLDIDSYIQRLAAVQDSKTIAIPSELHENLLVSFVIPVDDISAALLLESLKDILPTHQLPDEIQYLDSFPLNNSERSPRKRSQGPTMHNKRKQSVPGPDHWSFRISSFISALNRLTPSGLK